MSADTSPPLIELRHVWRQFGAQTVLRDVSLQIVRGETVVLIGESGCGKSVFLKLIVGLLAPSRGDIWLEGRPWHARRGRELIRDRLRFGFLFQGAALFDSLDVYENIAFGLRQNTDLPEREIREIVGQRLHEVGLPATAGRKKPAELSGGMRKRVGLARALALSPEIILYDEPTTGLDPIMTDIINELILQTRARRPVTSIVVTHEMSTVRKVADRVVMLYPLSRIGPDDSQLAFVGSPTELYAAADPRIAQFVRGEAGDRLRELLAA